jgi:hypothetical protein
VTRRAIASILALVAVAGITVAMLVVSRREVEPAPPVSAPAPGLALLVVTDGPAPLIAVVGSPVESGSAAVAVPASLQITIPGEGEGTVGDAVSQPGATGEVAVSNLLGMWIEHRAITTMDGFLAVVRRLGGVELGGRTLLGRDVRASLDVAPGAARDLAWRTTLEAFLRRPVTWTPSDLTDTDDLTALNAVFADAAGDRVRDLPTEVSSGGVAEPDLPAIGAMTREDFGAPTRRVVSVALLNGSGFPGVGQRAARLLVPGGFRVVVSENAASFDHEATVIVVPFHRQLQLAQRVRDWLGVGQVAVAGPPSGLADVTVVIGKDLGTA